jgi:uncharacterized protein (TIGR02996 family)
MSLEEGFLADVIANPDDDTPRLVFTDWLEENGDPVRAEFIRLQCRLAQMSQEHSDYEALDKRMRELLEEHRYRFLGPLVGLLEGGTSTDPDQVLTFRRGFVEKVSLRLQAFVRHADDLFANAPLQSVGVYRTFVGLATGLVSTFGSMEERLRRLQEDSLRLNSADREALTALAACPHMSRIRALSLLSVIMTAGEMEVVARSPYLTNLTDLCINGANCGDVDLTLLASSPIIERLTALTLGDAFAPDGLRALLHSDHLGPLASLSLWGNRGVGPTGAAVVAGSPRLQSLTTLNLNQTDLGDEGVTALATSPYLSRLVNLRLTFNEIGPAGGRALAASANLANLSALELGDNPLRPEGARALAGSPQLTCLTSLRLGSCAVGTEGAAALASSPILQRLAYLDLGNNEIGVDGVVALARSTRLTALRDLDLSANGIRDEGARALASSPLTGQLRRLRLEWNDISAAGVEALARSPALDALREFYLGGNPIGDEGARALVESPFLDQLELLDLQHCNITPAMRRALQARLGDRLWIDESPGEAEEQD